MFERVESAMRLEYLPSVLQLQQDIQMKQNEVQRETRKREKMDKELTSEKKDLEARTAEIKALQGQLQRSKDDNTRLELQLKEQRVRLTTNIFTTCCRML